MTVSRVVRKVLTMFELGCEIKSDLLKSGINVLNFIHKILTFFPLNLNPLSGI